MVEGALPPIAAARGAFNVRFAQPTRLAGTQHTEAQFPGAASPTTSGVRVEPPPHSADAADVGVVPDAPLLRMRETRALLVAWTLGYGFGS